MFRIRGFLLATLAAVAAACGGGGSSGMSSSSGGMMNVMETGVITGFGSIFLNGTHFQTSSATIRLNGQTVDQSRLAVGEVARIKGEKNADGTGNAEEVEVDDSVIGKIDAISGNTVTVLAQTIMINAGTSFSKDITPADVSGLKTGEMIRVDGLMDASGNIVATRIDLGSSTSTLQVVGTVAGLDTTAHTFMINMLKVAYMSATLEGFSSAGPSGGDTVVVNGTSYDSTSKTLTATQVRRVTTDKEEAGDERDTELEGLITRFMSKTDFDVGTTHVTTTDSTTYRNGSASDLNVNVKVEVEGMYNSSNVLVASVVEFEHNGGDELQGQPTAVNTSTLTLLGVTIKVDSMTRFEDESSAAVANFNLSNVTTSDTIRVRGFESPAGSGMLLATRVERESPSTTVIVKGPFTAATSPDFKVLGITIDASSATIISGDTTQTLAAFLAAAVGHSVFVEGTLSGTTVMAGKIRIDDESGDEN